MKKLSFIGIFPIIIIIGAVQIVQSRQSRQQHTLTVHLSSKAASLGEQALAVKQVAQRVPRVTLLQVWRAKPSHTHPEVGVTPSATCTAHSQGGLPQKGYLTFSADLHIVTQGYQYPSRSM